MPRHSPTTVVLARFDDLIGAGLLALLESDPSLTIVAADVEHRRLGVSLRAHAPDVAIIDADALAKLADVRKLIDDHPTTRLVLLARDPTMAECAQLLAFGASACLGRDTQSRDVLNAIHLASRGLQVIPRTAPEPSRAPIAGGQLLTRREAEILPMLAQGRSNAEIALALNVGIETVRTHASNIYRKLGVSSRRELVARAAPDRAPQLGPSTRPLRPRPTVPLRPRRGHGLRRR